MEVSKKSPHTLAHKASQHLIKGPRVLPLCLAHGLGSQIFSSLLLSLKNLGALSSIWIKSDYQELQITQQNKADPEPSPAITLHLGSQQESVQEANEKHHTLLDTFQDVLNVS